jgi:hypothetical protein
MKNNPGRLGQTILQNVTIICGGLDKFPVNPSIKYDYPAFLLPAPQLHALE